jgi:hypothetical protein
MSNVIDFLERMGQDANLRYADDRRLDAVLTEMSVEQGERAIVLRRDQSQLEGLLGASANVCCTIEAFDELDVTAEPVLQGT